MLFHSLLIIFTKQKITFNLIKCLGEALLINIPANYQIQISVKLSGEKPETRTVLRSADWSERLRDCPEHYFYSVRNTNVFPRSEEAPEISLMLLIYESGSETDNS